jgi:hypothetical protein
MSAAQVIEEIKQLTPAEQAEVIRFAFKLARKGQLTGEQLGGLANRMAETNDPAEASRLQEEIVRGFYGDEPHA